MSRDMKQGNSCFRAKKVRLRSKVLEKLLGKEKTYLVVFPTSDVEELRIKATTVDKASE